MLASHAIVLGHYHRQSLASFVYEINLAVLRLRRRPSAFGEVKTFSCSEHASGEIVDRHEVSFFLSLCLSSPLLDVTVTVCACATSPRGPIRQAVENRDDEVLSKMTIDSRGSVRD